MIITSVYIFAASLFAGLLGAMLGLGGGIIIIPFLTLLLKIDIRYAIGASIISVIATSSGAAAAYVRDRITNVRIAMFLEIATTAGALTGAFITGLLNPKYLYILFGALLLYSALIMYKKKNNPEIIKDVPCNPISDKLGLRGCYYDKSLGKYVEYNAAGVIPGFIMMYVAGVISGLLGIGSGVFKVIAMDVFMKLPMKVSTATSNFMIGVTAAASSLIYFSRGNVRPDIAAPVAIGVLIGSTIGSKIMERLKSRTLRMIFVFVLIYISIQMIIKGLSL